MQDYQLKETMQKTVRFEVEMLREIEKLAEENERDFSKQIKFMLKKYLQLTEK